MALAEQRKGELFVGLDILLTAFLPVVATITYHQLSSISSLAWTTTFAALVCGVYLVARGRGREMGNARVWKYGILSGFYIGILFYLLYYAALQYTSPNNVSILNLFQVFTTFVFFNLFRREAFSYSYKVGAALMIVGAVTILARHWQAPNTGDLLILLATIIAPIGNYYQQEGRKFASAETLLFLRTAFAALALLSITLLTGTAATLGQVSVAMPYVLFNSVAVFFLAKLFWIEGIHRISVTKAIALAALGPFFTMLFSWLILAQAPTIWQLLSLAPFALGVLLLTDQLTLFRRKA